MSYHSSSSNTNNTGTTNTSTTNTSTTYIAPTTTQISAPVNTQPAVIETPAVVESITTGNIEAVSTSALTSQIFSYTLTDVIYDESGTPVDYLFSDSNQNSFADPDITVKLGSNLVINNIIGGHPFEIKETISGVVVATEDSSTNITSFVPQFSGEGFYTYYCKSHPNEMRGLIHVSASGTSFQNTDSITQFDFVPRYTNTGSIGSRTSSWRSCYFNQANIQDLTISKNFHLDGSGYISNVISDHLFLNEGMEFSSGASSYMGESSPTNARASSLAPYNQNSENLHATHDGVFFGHNIFGDLTTKQSNSSWKKIHAENLTVGNYSAILRVISTKLSNGRARLYAQVASDGEEAAIGRYSDDYGLTWQNSTPEPASYFYGGSTKTVQAGWSKNIDTSDNLMHVYGSEDFSIGRNPRNIRYNISGNITSTSYIFVGTNNNSTEDPIIQMNQFDHLIVRNDSHNSHPFQIVDQENNPLGSTDVNGVTTFIPSEPGQYIYRCINHPSSMTGIIQVAEASLSIGYLGELYNESLNGLYNHYASHCSDVIKNYHIFSQLLRGDNIWSTENNGGAVQINLTAEECKHFEFVVPENWSGLFNREHAFGHAADSAAKFYYPKIVCDSYHDIIYGSQVTNPRTDTLNFFAKGCNKLIQHKISNNNVIDPDWLMSQPQGTFVFYLHNGEPLFNTDYRFEPSASNDNLIYIGNSFVPAALFSSEFNLSNQFQNIRDYTTPGVKILNFDDFTEMNVGLKNLRDFKYVNDNEVTAVDVHTGEIYILNTLNIASSLILDREDGSDWNSYKKDNLISAISKYKNTVYIDGIPQVLSKGESANKNFSAIDEIHYYIHDNSEGRIVGIGDEGWASERNLGTDKYESISSVWKNTSSNGFSAPSFSEFSAYHEETDTLTCAFESVLSFQSPPRSVDVQNVWRKGYLMPKGKQFLCDFTFLDKYTKVYSYQEGTHFGIYTASENGWKSMSNRDLVNKYTIDHKFVQNHFIKKTDIPQLGFGKTLPGHMATANTPFMQGKHQPFIRLADDSILYTTHTSTNSLDWNKNSWAGVSHLSIYRFSDHTFSNLLQSRVISLDGPSNGHLLTYAGSAFTLGGNLTKNIFRDDYSSHPYELTMTCIPGLVDLDNYLNLNIEEHLFEDTNHSSKISGVFYLNERCTIVVESFGDMSLDSDSWVPHVYAKNGEHLEFISTSFIEKSSNTDGDIFSYTFLLSKSDFNDYSDRYIYSYLESLGKTEEEIYEIATPAFGTPDVMEVELWFSLSKFDSAGQRTAEYKKMITLREGTSEYWNDEPMSWENSKSLSSGGNFGFIFADKIDGNACFQMPNKDLIYVYDSNWGVAPIGSLSGVNGEYLNDETWVSHALDFGFKISNNVNLATYSKGPNKGFHAVPDQILCSVSENAVLASLVGSGQRFLAYMETNGIGGIVAVKEIYSPFSSTISGTNLKCFQEGSKVYYINQGRIWHADTAAIINASKSTSNIQPDWEEITESSSRLSYVNNITYHPSSKSFYLLGNDGLYSKSDNGINDWNLEFRPQYSFSSSPFTGLYKDTNHGLHLVNEGISQLSATPDGIESRSIELKDSELPESSANKLYNNNGSLYWNGQPLTSSSNIITDQSYSLNNLHEISVLPGFTVFIGLSFFGINYSKNIDLFGSFDILAGGEIVANEVFADINGLQNDTKFYFSPNFSKLVGSNPSTHETISIRCNTRNIDAMNSESPSFKVVMYYI
jgi:plastocyanin